MLGFCLERRRRIGIFVERIWGEMSERRWERGASREAVGGGRASHHILFLQGLQ